jgi:hypothetical protein
MKEKTGKYLVLLSMLGLLTSCAQTQMRSSEAQHAHARGAAKDVGTHVDHSNLAKQYENMARELLAKAEERKKLLQHYEEKSYLYGRQAQDMQSRAWALLHKYEKATKETVKQAAFHRKMALELAKSDYATQVD